MLLPMLPVSRRGWPLLLMILCSFLFAACSSAASRNAAEKEHEAERLTKTVFAEKLGAYLVYSPLKAGKPSNFALHLTDLGEGTPVAKAEVTFNLRAKGNQATTTFKTKASETVGVYTAEVAPPKAGEYYAELQINHPQFSGRLTMTDFDVE
jgi:hypothetical protein